MSAWTGTTRQPLVQVQHLHGKHRAEEVVVRQHHKTPQFLEPRAGWMLSPGVPATPPI